MKFIYAALGALLLLAGPDLAADIPPGPNGDLPTYTCAYPGGPKTPGRAPTLLSYSGTSHGELSNLTVERSSGDPAQDATVMACVSHWRFDPESPIGKLNIGRQHLTMGWGTGRAETELQRIGIAHQCMEYYPAEVMTAHIGGITTVRFTITAEGRVVDPAIAVSSGNAALDAAGLTCARNWHFRPAMNGGQPVAAPWKVEIQWVPAPPQ